MLNVFIYIILKSLPLFLLFIILKVLVDYKKKKNVNYINYIYILKFIIFSVLLIIYYIFYIFIYIIYFTFKNFRFFKYYNVNINTAFFYYKKKSIYFLFWRYLVHTLFFSVSFSINYLLNKIKINFKNLLLINNLYLLFIFVVKAKLFINNNILIKIYNFYIYCVYHLFFFFNIDEMFNFIKILNFNIFNILTYIKDPILNRNNEFTWFTYSTFFNYKKIKKKKYIYNIKYKNKLILIFFF